MEKYYKRVGRRFVQVNVPQIIDNAGKYYQQCGTFVSERTEDSIGLCILSYATHHVVMYLKEIPGKFTHNEALTAVKVHFLGKGELPQVSELLTALIYYKKELGLVTWRDYRALSACYPSLTYVNNDGLAFFNTGLSTRYVAAIRPIIRIKQ